VSVQVGIGIWRRQGGGPDPALALFDWGITAGYRDGSDNLLDFTGGGLDVALGSVDLLAGKTDIPHILTTGKTGESLSASISTALNGISGDIEIWALINLAAYDGIQVILGAWGTSAATNRKILLRQTGGVPRAHFIVGTSTEVAPSCDEDQTANGIAAGTWHWLRVRRISSTGDIQYYTAPASDNSLPVAGDFTQLGATESGTSGALKTTNSPSLTVCSDRGTSPMGDGAKLSRVMVWDGLHDTGTLVLDVNAASIDRDEATYFDDSATQHEFTINRASTGAKLEIVNTEDELRFDGTADLDLANNAIFQLAAGEYGTAVAVLQCHDDAAATETIMLHKDGFGTSVGWALYRVTSRAPRAMIADGTANPNDWHSDGMGGARTTLAAVFGATVGVYNGYSATLETTADTTTGSRAFTGALEIGGYGGANRLNGRLTGLGWSRAARSAVEIEQMADYIRRVNAAGAVV
jgi:hypothetical protein